MSPQACQQLRSNLDVIDRFAAAYTQQFSALIQELNGAPTSQTEQRGLRLCVEAANMLLTTQEYLAKALRELAHPDPRPAALLAASVGCGSGVWASPERSPAGEGGELGSI